MRPRITSHSILLRQVRFIDCWAIRQNRTNDWAKDGIMSGSKFRSRAEHQRKKLTHESSGALYKGRYAWNPLRRKHLLRNRGPLVSGSQAGQGQPGLGD